MYYGQKVAQKQQYEALRKNQMYLKKTTEESAVTSTSQNPASGLETHGQTRQHIKSVDESAIVAYNDGDP